MNFLEGLSGLKTRGFFAFVIVEGDSDKRSVSINRKLRQPWVDSVTLHDVCESATREEISYFIEDGLPCSRAMFTTTACRLGRPLDSLVTRGMVDVAPDSNLWCCALVTISIFLLHTRYLGRLTLIRG